MKKLITSAVLTFVAIPFLTAAPSARQTQSQPASTPAVMKPAAHNKHGKKVAKGHAVKPAKPAASTVTK